MSVATSSLETIDAGLDGLALIRAAVECAPGRVALVSSFGAESAVLLDMMATVDRNAPVIFLDTGRHFPETHAYVRELCEFLGLNNLHQARPNPRAIERHDPREELFAADADSCCYIRKTEPLEQQLDPYDGWITGRKRFQGGARSELATVEREPSSGRLKFNPLAHWSMEDIRAYRRLRQLPLHPLVERGYGSIGCAPCTSPSIDGEDARAGRWRGMDKTECGIHLQSDGSGI